MTGVLALLFLAGCADVSVPDARNVSVPTPQGAKKREKAINERPDSVMYLPLGSDVLVPEMAESDPLPGDQVGPFELRSETLAGALQLILADYDIALAFETDEGLNRRITVANLRGSLNKVVDRVCSLADLYCSYEDGTIVVKDTQTFTVTMPPIGSSEDTTDYMSDVSEGLSAVLSGTSPIVDTATRTMIYEATQRTAGLASRYFQRLRASTAMIVFETYIWEVSLNSGNSTGIDWSTLDTFGKFNASFSVDGGVNADFTNPISIGLPTTQAIGQSPTDVVSFLSQFGAVKAISQPQITVLSGSSAELRVAETENFVSEITTTLDNGQSSTSVDTDSVDSGFTLTIGSSWDKATVYANISIALTDVLNIEDFEFSDGGNNGTTTSIQLPQTTERELTTQVRVRPGDSVLIAGLVQENDNFDSEGPGFMEPVIPQSRTATTQNLELVFLIRPRVVVYTGLDDARYLDYVEEKGRKSGAVALYDTHYSDTGYDPVGSRRDSYTASRPERAAYSSAYSSSARPPDGPDITDDIMTPSPVSSALQPLPPPSSPPVTSAPPVQTYDLSGPSVSTPDPLFEPAAPPVSPVVSADTDSEASSGYTPSFGRRYRSGYVSKSSAAPERYTGDNDYRPRKSYDTDVSSPSSVVSLPSSSLPSSEPEGDAVEIYDLEDGSSTDGSYTTYGASPF